MFIYRETDSLAQKWIRQYNRMFAQEVKRASKLSDNLSLACSEISGVMEKRKKLEVKKFPRGFFHVNEFNAESSMPFS